MNRLGLLVCTFLVGASPACATNKLIEHKVTTTQVSFKDRQAVRVVGPATTDEDQIAILANSKMRDGTISGYVAGRPRPGASTQARGFVGIAFRIDDDISSFEAVYLRPTNARAEDQLRRNHSIQYISYPDFPWHRLRHEAPAKYESYADMVPAEWVHYRLDVVGDSARLYLNQSDQPSLIVNDLKLGHRAGRVGLWIGPGTEAYFSEISVSSQ